jgi:hypothetical protein
LLAQKGEVKGIWNEEFEIWNFVVRNRRLFSANNKISNFTLQIPNSSLTALQIPDSSTNARALWLA